MTRRDAAAICCMASVAGLAGWACVANGFSYDDVRVVGANDFASDAANLRHLFTPTYFQRSGELSYRPVVTLSYFADYALWFGAAWGCHFTNLALHVMACVALYWLAVEAGFGRRVGFCAAVLFGVFPLQSEAICAIGFREDLLLAAFGFASLAAALRSLDAARPAGWLAAAGVLGLGAMFSKEPGVVLPALAFVLAAGRKGPLRRRVGAVAVLAACAGLYAVVRFGVMVAPGESAARAEWSGELAGPAAAVRTVAAYVMLMAWPARAAVVYGAHDLPSLAPAVSVLVLLAGLLFASARRRDAAIGAPVVWLCVSLAPVSNLVPTGVALANRLAYFPAAGFCVLVAALMRRRRGTWLVWVLACAAMLGQRCFAWRDDAALWREAVRRNPASLLARVNHAITIDLAGRDRYAEALYRRFLKLEPEHAKVRFNLAKILQERGEWGAAEAQYRRALKIEPRMAAAAFNLSALLRTQGRSEEAAAVARNALRAIHSASR